MALPGKSSKTQVCATESGTYYDIDGIKTHNWGIKIEPADTTCYKSAGGSDDYAGARTRNVQLRDTESSFGGDYLPADTNGQAILRTAHDAGTTVWIKYLPTGQAGSGWRVEFYVTGIPLNDSVEANIQVSYELVATSKPQLDNAA